MAEQPYDMANGRPANFPAEEPWPPQNGEVIATVRHYELEVLPPIPVTEWTMSSGRVVTYQEQPAEAPQGGCRVL